IPRSARPPDLAPLGTPTASVFDPDGRPAVERLELGARPAAATAQAATAIVFARRGGPPLAELLSAEAAATARAGEILSVRTTWRLLADAPSGPLDLFAHALDAGRRR